MQVDAQDRKGTERRTLRICEIYSSLQGEGLLTGTPSIFVRTSGCNLRCWFCDTPYASWSPEGRFQRPAEVVEECRRWSCKHIVLTGGEPMIHAAAVDLTERFHLAEKHITVETAGTLYLPVRCDLMSISPKLSTSGPNRAAGVWQRQHEARRERLEVVRRLMKEYDYQLKFVVDSPQDAAEVLAYLQRLEQSREIEVDRDRVLLMPQGTSPQALDQQAAWLVPWCQQQGLRFCERAHISWFGNRRGT